ncbi:MAG: Crp/Fnr family transcriptional regulator [bacterium]|nr:Crp/Fnr family transcriptional regulator [bacterium]
MTKSEFLGKVSIFNSLEKEDLELLANATQEVTYKKGQTIISSEELGTTFFIVRSGSVKVTAEALGEREIVLSTLHPLAFFGEMSILDGEPRSATITALEETKLITLEREVFLRILHRYPQITIKILTILCQRLRRADELIQSLRFVSAAGRTIQILFKLLDEHGVDTKEGKLIDTKLTHHDLASLSGTSRESMRKIIRYFQEKGCLKFYRGKITILDESILLKTLAQSII